MKTLSPLKSIREKCLDCTCWQPQEVRDCTITRCALYPYRFGKNPNRAVMGRFKGDKAQKPQLNTRFDDKTSTQGVPLKGGLSRD